MLGFSTSPIASASGSGSSGSSRTRDQGEERDAVALEEFPVQRQQEPQHDSDENAATAAVTSAQSAPTGPVVKQSSENGSAQIPLSHSTTGPSVTFPPAVHARGHSRTISILDTRQTHRPSSSTTTFQPSDGHHKKQLTKDAAAALSHRDTSASWAKERHLKVPQRGSIDGNGLRTDGRPSSSDSLPLQRVSSHGRDSVLEMDLADAAMEAMSAHDMAAPSMHEQARRRRRHRQRHRGRTPSVTSKQTKRTVRSRAGKAIRRRIRRRRDSTSSSSSSSSGSSSSSSSSGIDWRFWRSSTASSDSNDSYIPPEPTFTLYTPRLDSPLHSKMPSEADLAQLGQLTGSVPHPYTSRSAEQREKSSRGVGARPEPLGPVSEVFQITLSRTLNPCLDKLKEFWQERDQQEGAGGDLGAAHLAVPPIARGRPSSRTLSASRPNSRKASPDPSHPATSRKLRGTGAAWWLDVQCASTADMRMLRRLIPMHPLTIEDILAQETREKIESYEQLGYYFVAFRALDETYFRFSESASASSSTSSLGKISSTSSKGDASTLVGNTTDKKEDGTISPDIDEKSTPPGDPVARPNGKQRSGIVEIVEGHKEGVEGAGVGAVNVYLVVFGDGIISFHFEDISKHANRVKDRLTQFGRARDISSHWIAYGLMDSIVDTFFPLINFIEGEADEIDSFLANPLRVPEASTALDLGLSSNKRFAISKFLGKRLRLLLNRLRVSSIAHFFGLIRSTAIPTQREADFSRIGEKQKQASVGPKTMSKKALKGVDSALYDRAATLQRIAISRKLIMGLSRLLIPKNDVVRGLRKRLKEERSVLAIDEPGQRHDIGIYLGDLQDHIITMQQTLNFFDTMLSHDHPAYLGLLRLAYEAAKMGNDKAIVRLNIILVLFLPVNIYCGIFSSNVYIPHNTLLPNGRPAALWAFGLVIIGCIVPIGIVFAYAYWAIRSTRKAYATRKGVGRRL